MANVVAKLGAACTRARARLTVAVSNAWTSTAIDPAAARRLAGLRYWDGDCVS